EARAGGTRGSAAARLPAHPRVRVMDARDVASGTGGSPEHAAGGPAAGAARAAGPGSLEPPYGARDAGDMAGRIAAIPEHIRDALGRVARNPWRLPVRDPALLAIGGMGGSAMAGELTAALV